MKIFLKKKFIVPAAAASVVLLALAALAILQGPDPSKWSLEPLWSGKIITGAAGKICDGYVDDVIPTLDGLDRAREDCDLVGRQKDIDDYLFSIESYAACHRDEMNDILADAKEVMGDVVEHDRTVSTPERLAEVEQNRQGYRQNPCPLYVSISPVRFHSFNVTLEEQRCLTPLGNAARALEGMYEAMADAREVLGELKEWGEQFEADNTFIRTPKECYLENIKGRFDGIKADLDAAGRSYEEVMGFVEESDGCGGKRTEMQCGVKPGAPPPRPSPAPVPKGKAKPPVIKKK